MPPSDDITSRSAQEMMDSVRHKDKRTWQTMQNFHRGNHDSSVMDDGMDNCGCARGEEQEDLVPPWMDWVESGIEFFGCEANGKNVFGRALALRHNTQQQTPKEPTEDDRDYAMLHEEFLESLLKEQVVKAGMALTRKRTQDSTSTKESSASGVSSASSITETTTGSGSILTMNSLSSTKTQKRRRPLKLHKRSPRSPRRKHNPRIAPIDAYNKKYNPANANTAISLEDIAAKKLKNPPEFLHAKCVLQKDKGKGSPLGSAISAEGRETCLDKIREKMSIVVQVSGEERQVSSDMKRRIAVVSAHTPSYIETRSIIELRLGFLSMQYGLLLRWDYRKTGKIVFMVLRKMCRDSFYTKVPDILHQETKTTIITRGRQDVEAPPLVVRNICGNHAIYQRMQGTEVVLVDTPYRVKQPSPVVPSTLTVAIKSVTGLAKKNRWTISMAFNGDTEVTNLHYNPDDKEFEPRQPAMKWDALPATSFDLACLEIRLYKDDWRKVAKRRLVTTMTLPLGGLVVQPSTSQATSWELSMPFTHDPTAKLVISLSHQSDYAHWLHKELQARRGEEVSGLVWKAPNMRRTSSCNQREQDKNSLQEEYVWDWLCGLCFKEYYLY